MQRTRQIFGISRRLVTCQATSQHTASSCWQHYATTSASQPSYAVPLGHQNSDLTSATCHIGLGRRRDLTLRQDIWLSQGDQKKSLAEVFKGGKVMLVGFPGGKVCTEAHLPGYLQLAPSLKAAGVHKLVAVSVGKPEALQAWAEQAGLTDTLEVYADPSGHFVRLMGLELDALTGAATTGPPCSRYAGIVDDGILVLLKVEATPGDLKVSDAASMLREWKEFFG